MSNLAIIISQEYKTDIKSKSFWISTLVFPIIMIAFGVFVGIMAAESDVMESVGSSMSSINPDKEMSGAQAAALMIGVFLTLFVMSYGAMIFNKVKVEKCNRIMEVMATCVTGRTMMLAKIISVGLTGLTQMAVWGLAILGVVAGVVILGGVSIPLSFENVVFLLKALLWGVLFFVGGYVFYGALFAAIGAMTDKNNENQEYVSILTFVLLGSFYIGMYAVDHPTTLLSQACSFIPLTASTVGAVGAISGDVPFWESLLSIMLLWGFAFYSVVFAGKIYTSTLLLKGKKLTPKDILLFFKSK